MTETCKIFKTSTLPIKKDLGQPDLNNQLMEIDVCPIELVESGCAESICAVCPGGRVIYASTAHNSMDFISSDRE